MTRTAKQWFNFKGFGKSESGSIIQCHSRKSKILADSNCSERTLNFKHERAESRCYFEQFLNFMPKFLKNLPKVFDISFCILIRT